MDLLDLHLGRGADRGALSVWPVFNGRAVGRPAYDLGAEELEVTERPGSPDVGELLAANLGERPVLVLEGETLAEGWQHRIAARTVVVPARGSAALEVRCVEAGRFRGQRRLRRDGRRAPVGVRASVPEGQERVWQTVGTYRRGDAASPTSSLLEETRAAEQEAARLVADLRPVRFSSGVMIGIGGQVALLEVFDSPLTLARAYRPLLRAAAVDAAGLPAEPTPDRRARRFLDRVRQIDPTHRAAAGAATALTGTSPYARLTATAWEGRVVHATAIAPSGRLVRA